MTTEGLISNLNRDAFLSIGRKLEWMRFDYSNHSAIPAATSAGKALTSSSNAPGSYSAPAGLLSIRCREQPGCRTARWSVTTLDLTATYNLTINGTAVSYNASSGGAADLDDVLEGMRDAILANSTLTTAGFTAAIEDADGDGSNDTVVITRGGANAADDYPIDAFSATGSGVTAVTADALDCDADVFVYAGGVVRSTSEYVPPGWDCAVLLDGTIAQGISVGTNNRIERLLLAGLQRVYVRLYNLTKSTTGAGDAAGLTATAYAYVGTAVIES